MSDNDGYQIAVIDNEIDARLCAKLVAEEFASHEDLALFAQSTPEELFIEWLWPLTSALFHEKLSLLMRYCPTNEIVATVVANDLYLYCKKYPYDTFSPASDDPVLDLLAEALDEFVHYDFDHELKPNMVLFISVGATRLEHTGKKLAAQLRAHLCNYAREIHRFQYVLVQTTNPATRHIYVKKMNGKEMRIIDPVTWIWKKKGDGLSCPLKDYKGEPIVNILIDLNELKQYN
ncbi:unnamed protein product [Rotaria sp. Silwood1]|nr:unnamed protein product [Rotaria sp. Silwood1]CAF4937618.1 unnamed protein product [Rotaria sp. Silwood1]